MFVILDEKNYQKAKNQIETLNLVAVQAKAIRYIKHYENPEKYSTKYKIYIKDKSG